MNPMAASSVLHAVLVTGDFERTVAFYRDLLGLSAGPVRHHEADRLHRLGGPPAAIARAVILKAPDGTEIEIACFERPRGSARTDSGWQDAGIRSVTFVVPDIRRLVAKLKDSGYRPLGEVTPFIEEGRPVLVAYVDGPDGVIVTLLQTANVTDA
jgi:catechol 2,3-dioxygenase-like lactoylglutathione lyase family enzyme